MQPTSGAKSTLPCKKCGEGASQQISAGNFKFGHQPEGPAPQNTGASSVDHDVDKIIGRSAAANLREFQKRQDYKRGVITANNTTGDNLSRIDGGEYFVMSETERVAAKIARLKNQEAMQKIHDYKAAKAADQTASS
jgi:hypothetical protein